MGLPVWQFALAINHHETFYLKIGTGFGGGEGLSICFYFVARHNHSTHRPPGNFSHTEKHGSGRSLCCVVCMLGECTAKSEAQAPDQKDPRSLVPPGTFLLETQLVLELGSRKDILDLM